MARSPSNFIVTMNMKLAALRVLNQRLPRRTTLRVLWIMARARSKNTWNGFPPSVDDKDKGSRAQLGEAIQLHRALLACLPGDEATEVTASVIEAAAIQFLRAIVPVLDKEVLARLPREEQRAYITSLVDRFPNSDWILASESGNQVHVRVTRCRFPELLAQLGYPRLAHAFCAGDIIYFERYQPDIQLTRPCTIGNGDEWCDFIFSIKAK